MFMRPLTRDQAPGRPQLPPKVTDPAAFGVNSGVISGMRASCDIVVRVDVVAAIAAGMVRACPKGGSGSGAGVGMGAGV